MAYGFINGQGMTQSEAMRKAWAVAAHIVLYMLHGAHATERGHNAGEHAKIAE